MHRCIGALIGIALMENHITWSLGNAAVAREPTPRERRRHPHRQIRLHIVESLHQGSSVPPGEIYIDSLSTPLLRPVAANVKFLFIMQTARRPQSIDHPSGAHSLTSPLLLATTMGSLLRLGPCFRRHSAPSGAGPLLGNPARLDLRPVTDIFTP